MHAPASLMQLLAPWKELYGNSKGLDTAIVFLHLAALLFGGGTAIVADRAALRVRDVGAPEARQALEGIRRSHRVVLMALSFSLLSGLALASADLDTLLASPILAIKLGFVTLLLVNGALLTSTERQLDEFGIAPERAARLWWRLRQSARASLLLWTGTVLAGTALANMV